MCLSFPCPCFPGRRTPRRARETLCPRARGRGQNGGGAQIAGQETVVDVFEGRHPLWIRAESVDGAKGARSPMRCGGPEAFRQEVAASAGAASC